MTVRIEIGVIGPEGLKRKNAAGADIGVVEQRSEGFQDRGVGGLREQAQQLAVAFDKAAQHTRDGKGPVAVGHGSEDFGGEFFGEEY